MLSKPRLKMRFTMIELLAVITITAILLTMAMRVMKTDSTKANTTLIGSTLKFAQSYAISNLSSVDSDLDGKADEYVKVILEIDSGNDTKIKIITTKENSATGDSDIIAEESLAAGTRVSCSSVPNLDFGFTITGEPLKTTDATAAALTNATPIKVEDARESENSLTVTLKPFTGKVTYY